MYFGVNRQNDQLLAKHISRTKHEHDLNKLNLSVPVDIIWASTSLYKLPCKANRSPLVSQKEPKNILKVTYLSPIDMLKSLVGKHI